MNTQTAQYKRVDALVSGDVIILDSDFAVTDVRPHSDAKGNRLIFGHYVGSDVTIRLRHRADHTVLVRHSL